MTLDSEVSLAAAAYVFEFVNLCLCSLATVCVFGTCGHQFGGLWLCVDWAVTVTAWLRILILKPKETLGRLVLIFSRLWHPPYYSARHYGKAARRPFEVPSHRAVLLQEIFVPFEPPGTLMSVDSSL